MKPNCEILAISFVYQIDSYYQVSNNSIYKVRHNGDQIYIFGYYDQIYYISFKSILIKNCNV